MNIDATVERYAPEAAWCRDLNRWGMRPLVRAYFAVISRLGDGVFWYVLMVAFPVLDGAHRWRVSLQMAIAGGIGLALYRWMKHRTRRPRPFARHAGIRALVAPLDEFSFPSGHTLHAVAFSTVACWHEVALAWLLLPFAASVALSRVVLGLHYPSDVAAGTVVGASLAALVIAVA